MTDSQMVTLALAVVIPLSMLVYSISRITEAKETLRAEIQVMRADLGASLSRISSEILSLKADLKIHEMEHHHK